MLDRKLYIILKQTLTSDQLLSVINEQEHVQTLLLTDTLN